MRVFLFFLLLLTLPSWADGRPTTHRDVWEMRRLGGVSVSPDGRFAIVSVTEPDYDRERQTSDLWLVVSDGSEAPRRLTHTSEPESGVAWSPKGDFIAFSTKRGKDEQPQIYLLPIARPGEARRLTDQPTGASHPVWSPDGRHLLYEVWMAPGVSTLEQSREAVKAEKAKKENVSAYDGFPIRHWDRWLDQRKRHLVVQSVDGAEPPRALLAGSRLLEEPGYSGRPTLSGQTLNGIWTPDGQSVIFCATSERDRAARESTVYRLYQVGWTGGEPEALEAPSWSVGAPRFSSDGRTLYALGAAQSGFAYSGTELLRWDWPSRGGPDVLTGSFDRSVEEYVPVGQGRVLVSYMEAGRVRLGLVGGTRVAPLDPDSGGVYTDLAIGQDAGPVWSVWEDSVRPAEVVTVNPRDGKRSLRTSFNSARAAVLDRRPFESFWFTSSKGRKIHAFLALPPDFDPQGSYPLVLMIHGGPHLSSLDKDHVRWSPHLLAAPGYGVLMVDYTGSVGYGEKFARAIHLDPLRTPGEELLEAVDAALERYPYLDGDRLAATGASYGGHLVNWLQASTQGRFRCLVGHAGLVSLEGQWATSDAVFHRELNQGGPPWEGSPVWREQSPHTYAANFSTPTLLTIGEKDYRVPISETIAAWTYLQRQQVPSRLLVFHDANHWIGQGHDAARFWQEVHDWLARYLGPESDLPVEGGDDPSAEETETLAVPTP